MSILPLKRKKQAITWRLSAAPPVAFGSAKYSTCSVEESHQDQYEDLSITVFKRNVKLAFNAGQTG